MDKKKIIFDTDLGGDCDDVMALDLLLSCDRFRECELLAVTYSAVVKTAVSCIWAILNQHGYGHLPIGRITLAEGTPVKDDYYATGVAAAFYNEQAPTYETTPDAIRLIRKLLVENDEVTIVATGFLTNLAALFKSGPDDISPLSGAELVRQKVTEIAIMGGSFTHQTGLNPMPNQVKADGSLVPVPEYNILCNLSAAETVFTLCPVKLVVSPFELGYRMISGRPMCEHGKGKTPDSLSFILRGCPGGRDSFDPATALYGVFGVGDWFTLSNPGKVTMRPDGVTDFSEQADGLHYVLQCAKPQQEIAQELDRLAMRLFEE